MAALHVALMPICSVEAKIHASLMSLAIGDALGTVIIWTSKRCLSHYAGAPAEFSSREAARAMRITEMEPNRTFGLGPGHFTGKYTSFRGERKLMPIILTALDDTSMTLALAASLLEHQGNLNLEDAVERFVSEACCRNDLQLTVQIAWFQRGYLSSTGSCFDIGNATRATLRIHAGAGSFAQKQVRVNSEFAQSSKGNGSLMRCSSVPLLLYHRMPEHVEPVAALQSTLTHPNLACQEACSLYSSLLALILHKTHELQSLYKDDLLKHIAQYPLQTPEMRERFSHTAPKHPLLSKTQDQIKTSGYVVDTLEAVLWHFFHYNDFQSGLIAIVACGDDSDTVGAIYGALAGAFYCDGFEGVFWSERMERWKDALVGVDMLDVMAKAMAEFGVGKNVGLPSVFKL